MSTRKSFSVAKLKVGNQPFALSHFDSIPSEENASFVGDDEVGRDSVIKKNVFGNEFLSLYFEEGKLLPRPEVVYNITKQKDEQNPRNKDQIERDSQTFILIEVASQKIFISDFKMKHRIERWISQRINKNVLIKNIIDKDQFVNEIQSLKSIYLSGSLDLFSYESGILSEQLKQDIHNYGSDIKQMELKITFVESTFTEKTKQKILELFNQQTNGSIKKLEVSGRRDNIFDRVLNTENIIDRIEIEVSKKDNGLFDEGEIFKELIEKINSGKKTT